MRIWGDNTIEGDGGSFAGGLKFAESAPRVAMALELGNFTHRSGHRGNRVDTVFISFRYKARRFIDVGASSF